MKTLIRLLQTYLKAVLLVLAIMCCVINARAQVAPSLTGTENPDPNPEDGMPYILDPNYVITNGTGIMVFIQIEMLNPNATVTTGPGTPANIHLVSSTSFYTKNSYSLKSIGTATTADFQTALRNLEYATTHARDTIYITMEDSIAPEEYELHSINQYVTRGPSISSGLANTATGNISSISFTSATVAYTASGTAVTANGIVYMPYTAGTSPTLSNASKKAANKGSGSFTANLTGLLPNTKYAVASYATNSHGTFYGLPLTFTTLASSPGITSTTTSANPTLIIPNGIAVTVDAGLTIIDNAAPNLTQVVLTPPSGTTLSIPGTLPGGMTFTSNTLSGTASLAQYQAVLRTLQIATDTYTSTTGQISLTAYDSNGGSGTASLYVKTASENADATLSGLVFSGGALSPAFSPINLAYTSGTLVIPAQTITATTKDTLATLKINGATATFGTAFPLSLNKTTNVVTITVTSGDGATSKTYTLTVSNSHATNTVLEGLQLDPNSELITVSSTSSQINYTASVAAATTSVMIKPTTSDPGATVTVNGNAVSDGSWSQAIALNTDNTPTVATTVVTAGDGTQKSYVISISKNGSSDVIMEGLQLNPNSLLTTVSSTATQINYTTSVSTNSVEIKPTLDDPTGAVTVNGETVTSGNWSQSIPLNTDGTPTVVTTVVTSGNGMQKSYVVSISKNGSSDVILEGLQLNPTSLLTQTSSTATQISYNTSVSQSTTSVKIEPTTSDPTASITVNGQAVTSGNWSQSITLNNDSTPTVVTTVVTAGDGSQKSYVINITKNGSSDVILETLETSTYSQLTETSSTNTQINYSATITNALVEGFYHAGVSIYAGGTSDTTATITVNGVPYVKHNWSQNVPWMTDGTPTIITVVVTSESGAQKTYVISFTITGTSDASLAKLPQEPARLQLVTDVVVHQAVTPDGDGINDYLKIDGIGQYPDNKLVVLNSSGAKVYEAAGYDNVTKTFDGHSSTSRSMLQPGTYYYMLDYKKDNTTQHKTGYFVLKY